MPLVAVRSLTPIGTPRNGSSPAEPSSASASASASSPRTVTNELSSGSSSSMRRRTSSTSSREDSSFARTSCACSSAGRNARALPATDGELKRLDPVEVVLEQRDEEVEGERAGGDPHEGMNFLPAGLCGAHDDVRDEAEADPVGDRERERHDHDRQRGGEPDAEIREVDARDLPPGAP